jgi:tRNA(adenine34) deaminase
MSFQAAFANRMGRLCYTVSEVTEMQHERFMREAIAEARKAAEWGEVPIGAVIVRGEEIVARGHNLRETWKDPTAHAEMIALREASRALKGWRLTGCKLYVTLEPCPMCAGALLLARVDEVIFGAYEPKFGAVGSIVNLFANERFNHQPLYTGGILENECAILMKEFFRELRKR